MDTPRTQPQTPRLPQPPQAPQEQNSAPPHGVNWRAVVAWVVTTLAAALAGWLHGNSCSCRGPELPPLPPFRQEQNSALPAEAQELAESLRVCCGEYGWAGAREDLGRRDAKRFADTPAGQVPDDDTDTDPDVYLWLAAVKATGAVLPARQQHPVGSCVGFGTTCALEHLSCMQVVLGRGEQFLEQCQESIYALSRHQIGKDRLRGGDGSIGIWAAEAAKQYGVLARGKAVGGKYDLSKYDPRRCRQWGNAGPPADLLPLIKEHPCQDYAQCLSASDCRAALRAGYPIAVCSGQGFASTRDKDGFAAARGSWAHCMAIIGYRGGSRKGFYIENSWGPDWIKGPTYPAAGDPAAPPEGGFWADWSVVDRMARQKDTWAFSDLVGFPAANPWIVQRGPRPRAGWCRLRPEYRRAA